MKDWIKDIVVALAIALIIVQFVEPTRVFGTSMLPNFCDGDYLIINKEAYSKEPPKRGDVIVFESQLKDENNKDKALIKRVIGLPMDTVKIKDNKVYINGKEIDDSYTNEQVTSGDMTLIVPDGKVFCLGDNRLHSTDSRYDNVGCISEDEIVGKVIFRILPFKNFGKPENFY